MARLIFAAPVWILLLVARLDAGEKRPLALDDLYRQEQVTDFTISPRGDEAVYVRRWYDVNSPGQRTALWRVDGETGRHEPLEAGEPDGRMPVYSPDGKWLALVSGRHADDGTLPFVDVPNYSEPVGALWMLARGSSDKNFKTVAQRRSNGLVQLLADPFYARLSFSPDGNSVLTPVGGMFLDRHEIESLQGRDTGHGISLWEDQGEGYEGVMSTGFVSIEVPGVASRSVVVSPILSGDEVWYGDLQWLPNGKQIICHANMTDDQESVRFSINKNYDLWRFDHDENGTSGPIGLTHNPGPDVSPRISPDGKHVLYLSVPRKGPHADVYNLCVLPLDKEGAEPRVIVAAHDADREADGTPPFQPTFPLRDDSWIDDQHIRVRGVRGMKSETLVLNILGPEASVSPSARPEPAPHPNQKLVPPPVNDWKKERYEAREKVVRWKSFDGLEIEGVLTLPPAELTDFKAPYPVIVYPHGGPHSASRPGFNFGVHLFAAHGYAVFQPNFRGTSGYGRKFLDAARFDMGGSDMQDILTGVDKLIADGVVDKDRQFVYGISYGGYSTCRLVTLTDRFRAACAQNAVTDLHAMWSLSDLQSWTEWEFGGKPWETVEHEGRTIDVGALMRDRSPTTHAHKVKTPTLVLHSDHDRRCPLPMGQMFYRNLKEAGCQTELVVYKDERHGMWQVKHQADVLQRVLDWFAKHDVRK